MAKRKRRAEPVETPAAVSVDGVTKEYGSLVALAPTDLSVAEGTFIALIGHNGSGKSTLLKMAAGLLDATDGTITIHDAPAGSEMARASLSYIGDDPILYDDLSVREHVDYLMPLHGLTDWDERSDEVIGRLGLGDRVDDLPSTFSRGLRQKAALTLAFVRPFDVLLIDEPFVGLDQSGKAGLLGLLDEHHAAGDTIVVATHDLDVVERVDRCIALQNGEIVHDGPAGPGDIARLAG